MNLHSRVMFPVCKLLLVFVTSSFLPAQTIFPGSVAPSQGWNANDETTLNGTILEVVSKPANSATNGLNLRLNGAPGGVYANLGPYLSGVLKQDLTVGRSVQVIGTMRQVGGHACLLVRELVLDPGGSGQQRVTVRNARGFPAVQVTAAGTRPRSASAPIGGGR